MAVRVSKLRQPKAEILQHTHIVRDINKQYTQFVGSILPLPKLVTFIQCVPQRGMAAGAGDENSPEKVRHADIT